MEWQSYDYCHGPLTRYVKLRIVHAPGMLRTFSPAADFKGNRYLAIPACIMARASRTCRDACRDRLTAAFPAHAQPAILRIWQEAHAGSVIMLDTCMDTIHRYWSNCWTQCYDIHTAKMCCTYVAISWLCKAMCSNTFFNIKHKVNHHFLSKSMYIAVIGNNDYNIVFDKLSIRRHYCKLSYCLAISEYWNNINLKI